MTFLKRLLDRARNRKRDPTEPLELESIEAKIRYVLEDLEGRIIEADEKPGRMFLRRRPDLQLYLRALLDLFDEELGALRASAYANAVETAELSCVCRCKAHGFHGCARCLHVASCPVHSEPDPTNLERAPRST